MNGRKTWCAVQVSDQKRHKVRAAGPKSWQRQHQRIQAFVKKNACVVKIE
jgi:hypothetical protein